MESYEVLGIFWCARPFLQILISSQFSVNRDLRWFFGDSFMEEFPIHLEYTGIYGYLD